MKLIEKEQRIARRELGAAILLGPSAAHMLAITLIGKLRSLGYSRDAESAADLTGSDIRGANFTLANLGWRYSPGQHFIVTTRAAWVREKFSDVNPFDSVLGRGQYGEWVTPASRRKSDIVLTACQLSGAGNGCSSPFGDTSTST
jgi:hypothetical protein